MISLIPVSEYSPIVYGDRDITMDLTCDCYNCIICNFRLQHLQHLQTHQDREHRQPHTAGQKDRNVHDRRDYHSKVCITVWHNHRQFFVGWYPIEDIL